MKTKKQSQPQVRVSKARTRKPIRSADVPVTVQMLYGVRDQLIKRIDSRFHSLKSEIHEVKSEIHGVKSEIHEIKSDVSGLREEVHRLALLMEEQNARNAIVLDGLTGLFDRQDRLEKEMSRRF